MQLEKQIWNSSNLAKKLRLDADVASSICSGNLLYWWNLICVFISSCSQNLPCIKFKKPFIQLCFFDLQIVKKYLMRFSQSRTEDLCLHTKASIASFCSLTLLHEKLDSKFKIKVASSVDALSCHLITFQLVLFSICVLTTTRINNIIILMVDTWARWDGIFWK
jgi:hypothetical protein